MALVAVGCATFEWFSERDKSELEFSLGAARIELGGIRNRGKEEPEWQDVAAVEPIGRMRRRAAQSRRHYWREIVPL